MKNNKIELDLFYGDDFKNRFMHAADVFEQGKQLAEYNQFVVTGTPDLNKLCDNMKNALEKTGKNVVLVAIRSINGKRVTPRPYIKPNVQTISDGKKFGLFKDMLERIGYKVDVSECMQVINIKHN